MIRNHEETGGWNGMHLLIVDDNPVMSQTFRKDGTGLHAGFFQDQHGTKRHGGLGKHSFEGTGYGDNRNSYA